MLPEEFKQTILNTIELNKPYSYKELCQLLNIHYHSGGNGKKKQLEDLGRFVELEKVKTKYIIHRIKDEIDVIDIKLNYGIYCQYIEVLLLDYFLQYDSAVYYLTKRKLTDITGLYSSEYENIRNLNYSEFIKKYNYTALDAYTYTIFKNSTKSKEYDVYRNVLESLRKRALISYQKDVYMGVFNTGELEHFELDEFQIEKILEYEREILSEFNVKSKDDIVNGKLKKYYRKLHDKILEDDNVLKDCCGIYKCYKIIVNNKYLESGMLDGIEDLNNLMDKLNSNVVDAIKEKFYNIREASKVIHESYEDDPRRFGSKRIPLRLSNQQYLQSLELTDNYIKRRDITIHN